ncbi:MAG: carbohydrate porin [Gammaproteobacteria bacterium]|nr:carbohydrate porin [Gammaproteobacteria bacterium]
MSGAVVADVPQPRHGTVPGVSDEAGVEGGLVFTAQGARDPRVHTEALLSADLVARIPQGPGMWTIYLEGATSPRGAGVSSRLVEANADAGTALDGNGQGRIQLSELHYRFPFAGNTWCLGIIDPSGPLDGSDVAGDETSQFLGASFVRNPTIEFPDYTLGGCLHRETRGRVPGLKAVLASSHGLADNPRASYAQLLDVDENEKGVFAAGELYWQRSGRTLRLGAWTHTADHAPLDGSAGDARNFGAYALLDAPLGPARWNLRLGRANEAVSRGAGFAALALGLRRGRFTLGAGLARLGASSEAAGADDMLHAEVYARYTVNRRLHVTPSVQLIRNSNLAASDGELDDEQLVWGLRVNVGL